MAWNLMEKKTKTKNSKLNGTNCDLATHKQTHTHIHEADTIKHAKHLLNWITCWL